MEPLIRIEHLTKTFSSGGDVTALRDVSLEVAPGDIFGIIGMSGAGKSTLLRCIAMLETPTEGRIFIEGADLHALKGKAAIAHRKKVGVIFQGYNLLMQHNVQRNVAFPLELDGLPKPKIRKRVEELLRLVGLSEKADAYPSQLSGGQKQRVAIARALAREPKILLCDEPTSALDAMTTGSILDLLVDINHRLGVTVVIITHEIGVVKSICNRVAVIDEGHIAECGDTGGIFSGPQSRVARMLFGMKGGDET